MPSIESVDWQSVATVKVTMFVLLGVTGVVIMYGRTSPHGSSAGPASSGPSPASNSTLWLFNWNVGLV